MPELVFKYAQFTSAGGLRVDIDQLDSELSALSLDTAVFGGCSGGSTTAPQDDVATVYTVNTLIGQELTAVNNAISAHVPRSALDRAKAAAKAEAGVVAEDAKAEALLYHNTPSGIEDANIQLASDIDKAADQAAVDVILIGGTKPALQARVAKPANGVFGHDYMHVHAPAPVFTLEMSYQIHTGTTLVTPVVTGDYRIEWRVRTQTDDTSEVCLFEDGSALESSQIDNPSDKGNRYVSSSFVVRTFDNESRTYDIRFNSPNSTYTVLTDAHVEFFRVT